MSESREDARGNILLVEDSVVVRTMVRRHLQRRGFSIAEAEDGAQALEHCRRHPPDIVVMNIEMPVMDGRQTLRQMKLDPLLREIPVIFLTGRTSLEEMVAGLELGAHDYLYKPFDATELIARVSAALRVARLQQELNRRNAQLEALSRTDALTGLYNRRHGDEQLRSVSARSARTGLPFAVAMVDIDFFKRVNDELGHAAGDAVLREVAARIKSSLRDGDVAVRWGGEEFLLILPETTLEGATQLGARILETVRAQPVAFTNTATRSVTVSVGVACGVEPDPKRVVEAADEALYDAKKAGRNRISASC